MAISRADVFNLCLNPPSPCFGFLGVLHLHVLEIMDSDESANRVEIEAWVVDTKEIAIDGLLEHFTQVCGGVALRRER